MGSKGNRSMAVAVLDGESMGISSQWLSEMAQCDRAGRSANGTGQRKFSFS